MGLFDAFGYQGKNALVVGGTTGMGAAAVDVLLDAGAKVTMMDWAESEKPGVTFHQLDLSDRASIEAAVKAIDGPVHALFSCAGVDQDNPRVDKVNFLGHRLFIELLLESDKLPRGSAIAMISSAAGFGWEQNLEKVKQYLAVADYEEAAKWALDNDASGYLWTKMAINAYVAGSAMELLKKGIRINAILPGPTDTPLARANADVWLGFGADYRGDTGIEASTPEEQAYPLVFLCSPAASYLNGQTITTDAGYIASGITESYPAAKPVADFLYGRY
jgi:NAD(P)-dependent dehydrogenase (short-subunit alcohol dehydrogenase family)